MEKKPLEVKSYNVEDERRFKDLTARVVSLEYWRGAAQADMVKRIKALEQWMDDSKDRPDGCTEADLRFLERSNSDVWPRIAALEARCHELERSREVRYIPVDDHRDKERPVQPAPMMACPGRGTEDCNTCSFRKPHARDKDCCTHSCWGTYCQPVPAQEPVQPAPELVRCDYQHCFAVCCYTAEGDHRRPHERRPDCERQHCDHGKARCIPVPASPVAAIPDVPTPVGTEAFRRELRRHADELSQGYGYQGRMDAALMGIDEPWEHLAGVACTLRDAYELARTGENEAAEEKLREIEW